MCNKRQKVVVTPPLIDDLRYKAKKNRVSILDMLTRVHASHIGSAFSVVDILTVLYNCFIDVQAISDQSAYRDYLILSKGHSASALYVALAQVGIISSDLLDTFYKNGSCLGGHPLRNEMLGIEASTGSLGHGLSLGVGLALAARHNKTDQRVYVILGDGECQEGSIWEAVAMAVRFKLSNLIIIVDDNNLQGLCSTEEIMPELGKKFQAFGCRVRQIDGHSYQELIMTLNDVGDTELPEVIIAKTVKGKGVQLFENKLEWHYKSCNQEQYQIAYDALEKS